MADQRCGVFTTDVLLAIRTWDAWMEGTSGISAEIARGKALVSLFPEIETRGLINRFKNVLSTGTIEALRDKCDVSSILCQRRRLFMTW